ncbi:hypothetical protein PHLCEN_2v9424 [Hermanssonia centrifuga]|uniref:C2H2-type domain-containing protein n=1 Tax=Hermanssonia centrifuga TaxID=98765 RepID=A0A2R6NQS1_9APHY|nr:hypothetical protein PHLCEN_2v9424 [Hermanssonia centrifuga]
MPRLQHNPLKFSCDHCPRTFSTQSGLKRHVRRTHPLLPPTALIHVPLPNHDHDNNFDNSDAHLLRTENDGIVSAVAHVEHHKVLDAAPCNKEGANIPAGAEPPPQEVDDGWLPFCNRVEFELAEFLFVEEQMGQQKVDRLMDLWAATLLKHGDAPPFANHKDMHNVIDAIPLGDVPWKCFSVKYTGEIPEQPRNLLSRPDAVIRQMLENPDFAHGFDPIPRREFDARDQQVFSDFMTGNWAWRKADKLAENPNNKGAMLVPVIAGSDKTTVSVGTGQNEYYPLYLSIGNITNSVRRAHRDGLIPIAFLAIPKTGRQYDDDVAYRTFRWQLYHQSLSRIFRSLKPHMETPTVLRCPDRHYRRALYSMGPYIADYPEQALLAGIVQGWCPKCQAVNKDLDGGNPARRTCELTDVLASLYDLKVLHEKYGIHGDIVPFTNDFLGADIHELISPDLLHQIIKGTFKDHLVTWVGEYLTIKHGTPAANRIMDDIDRRIAATPPFPGLRHFYEGRRFKQWTGDDSKALMKIYLPAIAGHVPNGMVQAIAAFLDFCYLVRRSTINHDALCRIEDALDCFHKHRKIFVTTGVRQTISLPRQHSMKHYVHLIQEYGAPNGLCSSITESKHIKAVKEPWRRSNRFEALGQMLKTNSRLCKLAAARAHFKKRGMLHGTALFHALHQALPSELQEELLRQEGEVMEGNDDTVDEVAREDDDGGPVDGMKAATTVDMAKRARE